MKYILKLVSPLKWAQLLRYRERPADQYRADKVPHRQEHPYRRAAHDQRTAADMQSANSSHSG